VIAPQANAGFVANMEDVLGVTQRPHDPQRPLVCLDETTKQMIAEADWQFTTDDARVKLKILYPEFE